MGCLGFGDGEIGEAESSALVILELRGRLRLYVRCTGARPVRTRHVRRSLGCGHPGLPRAPRKRPAGARRVSLGANGCGCCFIGISPLCLGWHRCALRPRHRPHALRGWAVPSRPAVPAVCPRTVLARPSWECRPGPHSMHGVTGGRPRALFSDAPMLCAPWPDTSGSPAGPLPTGLATSSSCRRPAAGPTAVTLAGSAAVCPSRPAVGPGHRDPQSSASWAGYPDAGCSTAQAALPKFSPGVQLAPLCCGWWAPCLPSPSVPPTAGPAVPDGGTHGLSGHRAWTSSAYVTCGGGRPLPAVCSSTLPPTAPAFLPRGRSSHRCMAAACATRWAWRTSSL